MEIDNYYEYAEEKSDDNVIRFGWRSVDSIDLNSGYILGYHSRTRFSSNEEEVASKKEGTNAASLLDYIKFFNYISESSPEDFYSKWGSDEDGLKRFWSAKYPASDEKQYLFELKLSRLLAYGNKFTMYSRGFKLISQNIPE